MGRVLCIHLQDESLIFTAVFLPHDYFRTSLLQDFVPHFPVWLFSFSSLMPSPFFIIIPSPIIPMILFLFPLWILAHFPVFHSIISPSVLSYSLLWFLIFSIFLTHFLNILSSLYQYSFLIFSIFLYHISVMFHSVSHPSLTLFFSFSIHTILFPYTPMFLPLTPVLFFCAGILEQSMGARNR